MIEFRQDVSYKLDEKLRCEIIKIRDTITLILPNSNIYLFGSIAR